MNLPGFIWREPEIAQSLTNRPRSTCQHPHPPVLYAPSRVSKVMAIRLLHCRKAVPNCFKVRCPSGRRSTPGKCVYGNVSRVRIPPSPPLRSGSFGDRPVPNQRFVPLRRVKAALPHFPAAPLTATSFWFVRRPSGPKSKIFAAPQGETVLVQRALPG